MDEGRAQTERMIEAKRKARAPARTRDAL
jgi:hypothetical protein